MKKLFVLPLIFVLILSGFNGIAQNAKKFGHIDTQALLTAMPERTKAQEELKKAAQDLQDQLEIMQVEYNKKYQNYLQKQDSISALVKRTIEQELVEMQQRIQEFQANAQQDLQKQEADLFQPIMEKAKKAIEEVGKENGFIYIFDANTLLFKSQESTDILPLVKKKLGIGE